METLLKKFTGKTKVIVGTNLVLATTAEHVSRNSLVWSDAGPTNLNSSFGAGHVLEIASSSTADDLTGTGARTMMVVGAEGGTGKVIEELITLDGQTSVISTKKFQLVYGARVNSAGTGLKNAGIIGISIADSTNGSGVLTAPTPAMIIPAGLNYCTGAVFMCPPNAGKKVSLKKIGFGASDQSVMLSIVIRDAVMGIWHEIATLPLGLVASNEFRLKYQKILLNHGDVIRIDASSTANGGKTYVKMVLEDVYEGPQL